MKLRWMRNWQWLFLGLIALAAGCATADSDNRAERPWNSPKSWEYGLPPSMMEGR